MGQEAVRLSMKSHSSVVETELVCILTINYIYFAKLISGSLAIFITLGVLPLCFMVICFQISAQQRNIPKMKHETTVLGFSQIKYHLVTKSVALKGLDFSFESVQIACVCWVVWSRWPEPAGCPQPLGRRPWAVLSVAAPRGQGSVMSPHYHKRPLRMTS